MKLKHLIYSYGIILNVVVFNIKNSESLKRTHRSQLLVATSSLSSSSTIPTVTAETTAAAATTTTTSERKIKSSYSSLGLSPEYQVLRKVYDDCIAKTNFIDCLKLKAINGLARAINQDSIKLYDGIILEKQNRTEQQSIIDMINDDNNNGRSFSQLSVLDRNLLTKIDKLIRSHTLKVDMLSTGRKGGGGGGGGGDKGGGGGGGGGGGKKEKGGNGGKYMVAALLTAMGIAGPIGLKALAVIAGKALVISKVALTIATIIALKKLFSHDHHEESSVQVHAGDHNRRNTYVLRQMPAKAIGNAGVPYIDGHHTDPYRYYYEYH